MARILIVEDDPAIQSFLVETLRAAGHDMLVAGDGQTGVTLAQEAHPDLVLMDLQLPVLDGAAATRLLKSDPATGDIRIIAMSAAATFHLDPALLPADGMLEKPFDLDVLLGAIHGQLVTAGVASP
ncbi:response regulator [Sphaerobacter thermophilus]|uniref:Response regulator receiver protein n=1 Tax=Sphaerobacter thermophilus (strain ATCC 49802 / DSM 20745 / KCCM 41009 / NCIMB 13125 / S 6022) TaxID=479434 RepID=D1C9F7_SPHTD|nr:response regulator [Sphaerobacter thermophilus]ACZ40450.1 response regulator receiver protein [Sphaerobacter thermophilus DSM 20745]